MSTDTAVDLVRQATTLGLLLAAPALVMSLAIGLVVSLLQAVTQIHEQTLSFVPRLIVVAVVVLLLLPWSISRLVDYTTTLYREIPSNF
ncbi:MAG: flagellar biosynthesis protein FliQ [Planctomycetaceae bacterium]|nr:flagellar biosynthesis protein FliQ [Planctomycetaceae bacterium]